MNPQETGGMSAAVEPVQLRPLGLGEIFDRAVTLYIRNIVPLTIVALAVVLPITIAQYFATANDTSYQQLLAQIEHPGRNPATPAFPAASGWLPVFIGLALLLSPFATVAIAAATARIYRGEPVLWRDAYAVALRHWITVIVTVVCEIAFVIAVVLAGVVAISVVFASAFLLVRAVPAAGVVVFILAAIAFLVFLLFLVMCYMSFAFAFNAIGIEEVPFNTAISRGFSRIFNRTEIGRAAVISLALMAVYAGLTTVSMIVATLLMGFTHLTALNSIAQGIVTLISTAFLGLLIAVYYFDVRVRREGLDLAADIQQLQSPAAL